MPATNFPLIFQISQLPDLKSQKYVSIYGQGVRSKFLSSQKNFLLLLTDICQVYNLTFSIRYLFLPERPFDQQLEISFVFSQAGNKFKSSNTDTTQKVEKILTEGFLSQFYKIKNIQTEVQANQAPYVHYFSPEKIEYIGEIIKYEQIISGYNGKWNYYVPLPWEADEANDMCVLCEAIASFRSPIMLEVTLQPDPTPLQEKSIWINALNEALTNLKQVSNSSILSSSKEEDKNAQVVLRIYEKYQSTYLTESLYRYNLKVLGKEELAVRAILGTLLLSGTKKSRYRTIIFSKGHPKFQQSINETQRGELSTTAYWQEWDKNLGSLEKLKPLHRLVTLNEISGLFRIVVPGDAPVKGIKQENNITNPDGEWIDFGGHATNYPPENIIRIKLDQLNKHTFICGVPGSGKTTTAFNLLTQLWFKDIPFLVFESAKTEYRSLLAIKPDSQRFNNEQMQKLRSFTEELRVYTLGNELISPFRFNPFEVSKSVPFYEHIANLEASFRGALPLFGPLPALLSEALEEIYYERGWTGIEVGTPKNKEENIPSMRDLSKKIYDLFEAKNYTGEIKSNLRTALEVRIGSLLSRGIGAMLNTQKSSPTIEELLKYPTILELDYLNQDQANLMTFFLLTKIREYVKRDPKRVSQLGKPAHVILLEEAHNIVGRNLGAASSEEADTKKEAANYVTRMLAEMRALREAIIIADQLPTAVAPEVIKNTNLKIAHRLVSADDRKDIGQAMLLDNSQTEEIARLMPGQSFLYMEGWYRPHLVTIPYENSAKVKLSVESSCTDDESKKIIKLKAWYKEMQKTLFTTARGEHERLYKECEQTLKEIDSQIKQINNDCDNLNDLLKDLKYVAFHILAGVFRFKNELPENLLQEPTNLNELEKLKPEQTMVAKNLVELRYHLNGKFQLIEQQCQQLEVSSDRFFNLKNNQRWKNLNRQLQNIGEQVSILGDFLGYGNLATNIKEYENNLKAEEGQITRSKRSFFENKLKRIKEEKEQF